MATLVGKGPAMRDVHKLKKELATIAQAPNRSEPEMIGQALGVLSRIFVAEHPEMGNGTME